MNKVSPDSIKLREVMDSFKFAYHESDDTFTCPICKTVYDVDSVPSWDCNVVECTKCNYSYCVKCSYIYDPEPNFPKLLGIDIPKTTYILLEHAILDNTLLNTDNPFIRTHISCRIPTDIVSSGMFEEVLVGICKSRFPITLQYVLDTIDEYCYEYAVVKFNSVSFDIKYTLEDGDGTYLSIERYIYRCEPFF